MRHGFLRGAGARRHCRLALLHQVPAGPGPLSSGHGLCPTRPQSCRSATRRGSHLLLLGPPASSAPLFHKPSFAQTSESYLCTSVTFPSPTLMARLRQSVCLTPGCPDALVPGGRHGSPATAQFAASLLPMARLAPLPHLSGVGCSGLLFSSNTLSGSVNPPLSSNPGLQANPRMVLLPAYGTWGTPWRLHTPG